MNDRYTADSITSDALDELYERVATAEQEADTAVAAAAHLTTLVGKRSGRAEAAIARVRKACASVQAADQGHTLAVDWVVMRVLEAIDARLVNGASVSGPAATQATEAARDEAIRQLDADPHGLKAGVIVQAYTDHGLQRWVFRCWGTDTCDGWLSLDHTSQQSAERDRDRHVREEH